MSRVLLVDDDEDFRKIFTKGLQQHGFDVTAAASAQEALDRAAEEPGTFEVAVMDIELGDGWGASVAVQLRQHQPGMKVVFVSGHLRRDPVLREAIQDHMVFLEKPFLIEDLVRALNTVLRGEG